MRCRISRHDQPAAVASLMIPQFAMQPGRVVAKILIVVEFFVGLLGLPVGTVDQIGVAQIGEFLAVTRAEKGVMNNNV